MTMINYKHSGTPKTEPSKRETAHSLLARKAAAEGMVLLKNEDLLPLDISTPVALFGGGGVYTVKGGTGSGDVNNRESVSVYQGLKAAGAEITSLDWITDYEKRYETARAVWRKKVLQAAAQEENPFDAYAANPFSLPEGRPVTADDVKGAFAAVYVISRISGEGRDRRKAAGDYYLSSKEREDLLSLEQAGIPVVLLLNTGGPIELTDILQEARHIQAVLNISLPGQEGGHAAADVLFGRAAPGGKLTATWAKRYEDYPSAESFGILNGNLDQEIYQEGIYVGYRYFDSFDIKPLFPFGYGLSYTTFSITFEGLETAKDGIRLLVSVKNTGNVHSGREVVQAYITPPQTGRAKEYQRLAGFAKTGLLKPQEMQKTAVFIEYSSLAGYSEQMHAWVVEAGKYGLWIGSDSASLKPAAFLTVQEQVILTHTRELSWKKEVFSELGKAKSAVNRNQEQLRQSEEDDLPHFPITPVKEKEAVYQAPTAEEYPLTELIPLLYGNITPGTATLGSTGTRVPGSAGETTEELEEKYGICSLIMADGPAGLRLRQSYEADRKTGIVYGASVLGSLENGFLEESEHHENADTYYHYCTAFPVGTALAQSWDTDLMREFGAAIAVEMEEFHVNLWLAPGMNIQRNPLCGRNFEYYSEDPLLSGLLAAAVTDGVQSRRGCGVTLKHFACNNQEDNRMGVDVYISERTLREIYLRGFQIAIKKSRPAALMSSYNLVNGVHSASNQDLCTTIAREEWGFEGVIMSDWNTTAPENGSVPWQCIAAGNDLIMPGNPKDDENIRKAYEQGMLSEEKIRCSAGRILRMVERLTQNVS